MVGSRKRRVRRVAGKMYYGPDEEDLVAIAESRLGWAIAEQLRDVLKTHSVEDLIELEEEGQLNPNAAEYISEFLERYPRYSRLKERIDKYLKSRHGY